MFALFIDTSTERRIFSILSKDSVLCRYSYPAKPNGINEPLFNWLRKSMGKYALTLSDFTCIAVGYGPGPSFTGIRLGVALASSLAYAYSLPIRGLCSLELYKPIRDSPVFYSIRDAKGGELYYVEGKKNGTSYEFTDPKVMNIRCWEGTMANNSTPIISIQYEFFQKLIDKNVNRAIMNWDYIIKKIFQEDTYWDPRFFTIPYFKKPS